MSEMANMEERVMRSWSLEPGDWSPTSWRVGEKRNGKELECKRWKERKGKKQNHCVFYAQVTHPPSWEKALNANDRQLLLLVTINHSYKQQDTKDCWRERRLRGPGDAKWRYPRVVRRKKGKSDGQGGKGVEVGGNQIPVPVRETFVRVW
jgi:hypothetical protein